MPISGACASGLSAHPVGKIHYGLGQRIYQVVLELAAEAGLGCTVGDFSLAQLYAADEVFVTGTIGGLVPVLAIDGRQIGSTRPARSPRC